MTDWWQEFFLSGSYTLLQDIPAERTQAQNDFIQRALDPAPSQRLLDVACGIGRHSLALAERGVKVIGLDYSSAYLARAAAGASGLPARFVRGDMRALPFSNASFNFALNLFTSFGYFETDEENGSVLREIGRVLVPEGLLLLDIQNRDAIARQFQPQGWTALPDGYLLEDRRWDSCSGKIYSDWTFLRGGEARTFTVTVRSYTCPEIKRMLKEAGLFIDEVWGDWDGSPLTLDSRRIIIKARKRES